MIYLGPCWKCEGCGNVDTLRPWNCPGCGKEVCEICFDMFMHCKDCVAKELDKSKLEEIFYANR